MTENKNELHELQHRALQEEARRLSKTLGLFLPPYQRITGIRLNKVSSDSKGGQMFAGFLKTWCSHEKKSSWADFEVRLNFGCGVESVTVNGRHLRARGRKR
ncbi:MAG: hypothetical protein QW128_06955 [Thermoprotei archaeon]